MLAGSYLVFKLESSALTDGELPNSTWLNVALFCCDAALSGVGGAREFGGLCNGGAGGPGTQQPTSDTRHPQQPGLGANTHHQFLTSILEIEKPVALHKLSLTGTEISLYSSFGLFLKSAQQIKCFGIVRIVAAAELHHCAVIAPCCYPFLHSLREPYEG